MRIFLFLKFPFDDQLCVIVFGSWSYTYHYLNYSLMVEDPSLENYTEHNEWTLLGYKAFRHEIKYANWIENDTFSEIRYKILIQRKPLFVIQNCVIPAIMLCILTCSSFFIPFAQEMQIGISIMLAFSVFKLRLSDDVPVQSDSVPLVNIYFTICMSFSLAAMIWFSIANLLRENKRVPDCVRSLVLNYICYLTCPKYVRKFRNLRDNSNNCQKKNSPLKPAFTHDSSNHVLRYMEGEQLTPLSSYNLPNRHNNNNDNIQNRILKSHSNQINKNENNLTISNERSSAAANRRNKKHSIDSKFKNSEYGKNCFNRNLNSGVASCVIFRFNPTLHLSLKKLNK